MIATPYACPGGLSRRARPARLTLAHCLSLLLLVLVTGWFVQNRPPAASTTVHLVAAPGHEVWRSCYRQHNQTSAKVSFAVVTLHLGWETVPWARCSFQEPKRRYCDLQKYDLFDDRCFRAEELLPLRWWMYPYAARFNKLRYLEWLLRASLPYEYFLWVDGDTVFANQSVRIEERFEQVRRAVDARADEKPMFVLAAEKRRRYKINNGVWFVRNTPQAHAIMLRIYDQTVLPFHHVADQLSLRDFLVAHPDFQRHSVWVLPRQAMQLLQGGPSDWIFHLLGRTMDERRDRLGANGLLCYQT